MVTLESYIEEIIKDLNSKDKEEVRLEMLDHINLLKKEYVYDGFDEPTAIEKAIKTFGDANNLNKEIKKATNPLKKYFKYFSMTILILYMILLLGNLLFSSDRILIHSHVKISIMDSIKGGNYIPIYNTIKDYNNHILNDNNVTAKCIIDTSIKNIITFIPLGFLVPIAFNKCEKISEAIKVGFIVSGIIEITQVFFRLGIFDIDDVILNTLGTIVGLLCFKLFLQIENRYKLLDKLLFH